MITGMVRRHIERKARRGSSARRPAAHGFGSAEWNRQRIAANAAARQAARRPAQRTESASHAQPAASASAANPWGVTW